MARAVTIFLYPEHGNHGLDDGLSVCCRQSKWILCTDADYGGSIEELPTSLPCKDRSKSNTLRFLVLI
jgi:hypothetical protein